MNKKLFFAVVSLLLLGACNNDTTDPVSEKATFPVTFSLNALTSEVVPMMRAATSDIKPLSDYFTTLEYMGYASNVEVFKGTQTYNAQSPNDFGAVTVQASFGSYYLGFFGIGNGVGSSRISIGSVMSDNDYIESTGREIWYKEFRNYEIGVISNNIPVEMTRKTGRITLDITDQVPADVKKVSIEIFYASRYKITKGDPQASYNSTNYKTDIPISGNTLAAFEFNCFATTGAIVNLTVYDNNSQKLDEKNLTVGVYENRKTIISGQLFSNVGGKDFIVTVSEDWGEDNIVDL
jgi:hypothetical protein